MGREVLIGLNLCWKIRLCHLMIRVSILGLQEPSPVYILFLFTVGSGTDVFRERSLIGYLLLSRAYQVCLEAKEILDTFIVSDVVIVQRKYGFRLHVNGSVISAHRFHKSKTTPFMHTEQLNVEESIDYFFCFTEDRRYLIPREFVPVGGVTVHSVHTGGKYEPFLWSWRC